MADFMGIFTNKKERSIKREIKKVKKKKKRAFQTLNWIDVEEINQDHMILKKGNRKEKIVGIKISPPNIFLDTPGVQSGWVESLQFAMSSFRNELYHGFIYTPIELTDYFERFTNEMEVEEDIAIKEMYQLDIDILNDVERNINELSFFVMIKSSNYKKIQERYLELKRLFENGGFDITPLNQIDFSNLVKYEFDSESMLDVYLSRGEYELPRKEWGDE